MNNRIEDSRLELLIELASLLNSSLDAELIIRNALLRLSTALEAEASTIFLKEGEHELGFWALHGGDEGKLVGKTIPAGVGLVGWVIENNASVNIDDVRKDKRFFDRVDKETKFETRCLICVPLTAHTRIIGAIQVLNKKKNRTFTEMDLAFVERFSNLAALAIENALLYHEAQLKSRQLATLDRRKNDIIKVIIHEFRTPISILQNSIELLQSQSLNPEGRKTVANTINKSIDRLAKLISKIRDVSITAADNFQISTSCFLLKEVFDSIAGEFSEPLKMRNITLSVSIEPEVKFIEADHTLITVVLRNLVSNAIRFTDDFGKISLSAAKSGEVSNQARIAVEDTGIGISESEIPVIFDKFYEAGDVMAHSSGTYEFRSCGLGLGLSTVKAILEAHGTKCSVASELGKGSCFSFKLPISELEGTIEKH